MFGKKHLFQILFLLTACCISAAAQQDSPSKTGSEVENQAQIEYEKRLRQMYVNNLKIQTALTDGLIAFNEKKYDLAIEKFDEAIDLEPNYWGISPVLLTNKAMVLRTIGVDKYNEAARRYWNPASEANPYFSDAVDSLNKALQIFSETPVSVADSNRNSFDMYRFNALKELAECYRLLVMTDKTRIAEAIKAFEEYILIEPDEYKREKALKELEKLRSQK